MATCKIQGPDEIWKDLSDHWWTAAKETTFQSHHKIKTIFPIFPHTVEGFLGFYKNGWTRFLLPKWKLFPEVYPKVFLPKWKFSTLPQIKARRRNISKHGSDNVHMMNPCKRKTLELPILVQYKKVAMAHNKLRLMPPQLFPLGSDCTRPYIGITCVVRLRDSTGYESCRDSLIKGMSQLPKSWNTYLKSNSQLPKSCSWQLHHAAISSWENTCIS